MHVISIGNSEYKSLMLADGFIMLVSNQFADKYGPPELILLKKFEPLELRNKDSCNLFHCKIWTPSSNNYMDHTPNFVKK